MKKFLLSLFLVFTVSCSSAPQVKSQDYAQLKKGRTFEASFPMVWKAIEETIRKYGVNERDPKSVDENELKKIDERMIRSKEVFSQSRDKYVTYQVNGFPRKKYLQTRQVYEVVAKKVIGGVQVELRLNEEIQLLDEKGNPLGWESAENSDSSRAQDFLNEVEMNLQRRGYSQ
ncbi:MAG: hypothetical protein CL678_06950 [Bdellovibrionaceae bacterium]|nr:hypothetical protein [Pseudobdellovibrionaceae bacterium]